MDGSFGFDSSGENYYYNTNESHEQNTSDSQILEEEYDPNYEPGLDDIREYARYLGMNEDIHQRFFWIAREGLRAPLPKCWKPCRTDTNEVYYFNFESGQSSWEHPCDLHYKELFAEALEMENRGEKMPLPPGAKHVAYVDPDEETHLSQDKLSLPEDSEYNDDFEQASFAEKTLGKSTGELIGAAGALNGKAIDFTDVQFEEDFADHETDTKAERGGATGLGADSLGASVGVRGSVDEMLIPEETDADYTTGKSMGTEHGTGTGTGTDQTHSGADGRYDPSHAASDAYGDDSGYGVGSGVGVVGGSGYTGDMGLGTHRHHGQPPGVSHDNASSAANLDSTRGDLGDNNDVDNFNNGLSEDVTHTRHDTTLDTLTEEETRQTTPEKHPFGKTPHPGKALDFPEASETFDEDEYASHRASLLREHDLRMEDMIADLQMWEERLQRSLERREVRVAAAEAGGVGAAAGEVGQVESDLARLRGERETLRSERDALRAEVESMDAEVAARRRAHEAEIERARATEEEEKAALVEQQRHELAALREDHAVEREAMEARMEQLAVDEEDYEARVKEVEERLLALDVRVEELQRREEEVKEREHDLSERENVLSEQEHQIEEREQEISEKEKDLSEREKTLLEKNSDLSDFETSLAAKEQELMEREAALHRKTSTLGNFSEMDYSGSEVPSAASLVSGPMSSSVVSLQERIRVLEAENEHATRALVEAEDAVEALRGDVEPLRSEIQSLRSELTVLRAREGELRAEVERERKEKERLKAALQASGEENPHLSGKSEILELKAECSRLRDSISASERRCVEAETSLSTTRNRCDQLQTALQDAEEQLKHQRAAAAAATDEAAQHQRVAAREAAARAEVDAENARVLARLSAQRGNEADSAELVRVQQELQACRRMKAEVEADLAAAKADAARAARECERVSGEYDAAKADARRAREEVRLVEEGMGAVRGQVRVQQEEVLRVNAELATAKSELARVQADRDISLRKLEETDTLSERRYRSLLEAEDRARAAERKVEELDMRVRMSDRKVEDATEGLRTMERRCVEAEEKLRASERQCRERQARVAEVEEKVRAVERAGDGAGAGMGALAQVPGANNSNSNPIHTNTNATSSTAFSMAAGTPSDCHAHAARVPQLQRQLAEAEARVDVLQAQLRARTSESARATDELQLLQERLDRVREQLVRAQTEAEELRNEVARRQSENNTVKMDLRDVKDEYERQARDTTRARSEVARVQAECDRLAAEVARLQAELRTRHTEREEQDAVVQRLQQRLAAAEARTAQGGVQGGAGAGDAGVSVPVNTATTATTTTTAAAAALAATATTPVPTPAAMGTATAAQEAEDTRTNTAGTHTAFLGSPAPVPTRAFPRGSGTPSRPSFAPTPARAPHGSSLRGLLNGSLLSKYDTVLMPDAMSDHAHGNVHAPHANVAVAREGTTEQARGHLSLPNYTGGDERGSGHTDVGDRGSDRGSAGAGAGTGMGMGMADRGSYTASQPLSRTLAWEAENDTVMATSLLKTPVRHPSASASVSASSAVRGVVKPPAEPRSVADYLDVWASRELAMITSEREYLQTYKYQLLSVQSAMKERQAQWTKQRAELKMALHSGVAESTLQDQHEMLNRQRLELDGLASHINADIARYKRAKESVLVREQMVQAMLHEGKQMGFSQTQAESVGNLRLPKEDLGFGANFPELLKNSQHTQNSQPPHAPSALSDLDREMIAMVAATAAASESSKLLSQILSRVQAPLAFQQRWQRYMSADHDFSRMLETSIAEGAGPGTGAGMATGMGVRGGVPFHGGNGGVGGGDVGGGYGSQWGMGQMNSGTGMGTGMGTGANTYTPGVSYPLLPAAPRAHPYQHYPSTGARISSPSPSSFPTSSTGLTTDLSAQIRADLMRIMANRSRMRTGISNEVEAIKTLGERLNKEKSRNRWKAFQK